ncbi:putative leucine-rich repeat receptor-like serine/threonine-protein kinase [Cinnamomum micranthum f. kanehirae]|uniref:Putative leucine-rich repeat receptor-like serine/threonine-protein kinase n=1 Tax=Cinnamomum micranthum f. kanehirae TaxID=337451 RepID=A0A3S3NCD5_9MAGN|nr:putative leucine-rich repeat receptor-like serine/threonine-protein kinase [Cinnamomum micranthum f. kanehirae]
MNSLRFFPDQNKVCYVVYISTGFKKYLIRAGFYYGNYDGQMRPPTFDLQIDGNKWATIVTLLQQQPIFKEVIIMPLWNKTSICVAQTRDGEIPFIYSLELIELPMILYRWMDPTYAMIKEYRWNFGANETVGCQRPELQPDPSSDQA